MPYPGEQSAAESGSHQQYFSPGPPGPPGQPAGGFAARFVNIAYRQLKNIGESASHLLNAKPVVKGPTDEQVSARARQSTKILVRLLAHQGRFGEVGRVAAGTDCEEIVNLCIMRLIDAEDDQVAIMQDLARGQSKAAALALFGLLNTGYTELAREIFVSRMQDGTLLHMVGTGLTTPFNLVALAGRLDFVGQTNYSRTYFDTIWNQARQSPQDLTRFLGELLGDPDPHGARCVPVHSESVPQEIKLMALSLLTACSPRARERSLCFAASDPDEDVARLATTMLIDHWGSQSGCVPENMYFFAMLNMTMLFYLCNLSASFHWPCEIDFVAYSERIDCVEAQIEEAKSQRASATVLRNLENELDGVKKEVDAVVERRLRSLQTLVNTICGALNLPHPQLEIGQGSFMAAYIIGRGRIKVTASLFVDEKPLSTDLMSTLLHEIGHMEQDMLVIRLIADDLGLIFGQHSKLLRPLMERYADTIGYAPDPMFLLGVLRLRNDVHLTAADRARALTLVDSAYKTENAHSVGKLIEARMEHLEKSEATLESGQCDRQLLSCLANTAAIQSLFKQGQIPAVVLEEIGDCQQEFVEVMYDYLQRTAPDVVFVNSPNSALPTAMIGGRRNDLVEIAQRIFGRAPDGLLWIVERLRQLLIEVLKEESKVLRSRLSDVRREGYHEEEAYAISDRAEVIVNALRRDWYRVG
jgi:hypothetical protein